MKSHPGTSPLLAAGCMQPQEALLTVLAHKKPGDTVTVTAVNLHGAKHADKVTLGGLNVYANG